MSRLRVRKQSSDSTSDSTQYRDGLSFDEIGKRMGLSRQRVFFLYERALRKIRANPKLLLGLK